MAIDETELPNSSVGGQNDETDPDTGEARYSADDFRLRLDSPLFHRDPGMSAAQAPQLRELTWEHVVRPSHHLLTHEQKVLTADPVIPPVVAAPVDLADATDEPAVIQPVEDPLTPSIESLLQNARGSTIQPRPADAPRPADVPRPVVAARPAREKIADAEIIQDEDFDPDESVNGFLFHIRVFQTDLSHQLGWLVKLHAPSGFAHLPSDRESQVRLADAAGSPERGP